MEFDILNPVTWNSLKSDTPLIYNNTVLVSQETGEPIKAVDFLNFIFTIQNITKKSEVNESAIKKLLQRMLDSQNNKSKEEKIKTVGLTPETEGKTESGFDFSIHAEKDLEPVFTINGFSFSKALCDCCRDIEKETLEIIADAMNYCIEQKLKKYQYKQYFCDNFIPASKEFFVEIYFAEQYSTRKNVDNLVSAFYMEFEPETKEEIDDIIGGSLYLSAHTELISRIKEHLLTRYF